MAIRRVHRVLTGRPTSDGAGVKLTRIFDPRVKLDPFLLLDEFGSDDAADYIGGFPPHPHRGFETVTYMLDGEMLHEDHMGNRGRLSSGGVQWMTAARGIIHSEMPQQDAGQMRGFQLWLNLPAAEKMRDPWYRDIPPDEIPVVAVQGGSVKVIAGTFSYDGEQTEGAIRGRSTDPLYLDVVLEPGAALDVRVAQDYAAMVYVYQGAVDVADSALRQGQLGVLAAGDAIALRAGEKPSRALVLAARPIGEPVVQYGPFVMNTMAEVEQAIRDYRDGSLAR